MSRLTLIIFLLFGFCCSSPAEDETLEIIQITTLPISDFEKRIITIDTVEFLMRMKDGWICNKHGLPKWYDKRLFYIILLTKYTRS